MFAGSRCYTGEDVVSVAGGAYRIPQPDPARREDVIPWMLRVRCEGSGEDRVVAFLPATRLLSRPRSGGLQRTATYAGRAPRHGCVQPCSVSLEIGEDHRKTASSLPTGRQSLPDHHTHPRNTFPPTPRSRQGSPQPPVWTIDVMPFVPIRLTHHATSGGALVVSRLPFPKTLSAFQTWFATDEACVEYLARSRWPDGYACPHCGHEEAYELSSRPVYTCKKCFYQVSVTAGTVLHGTRLSLSAWFSAAYLVATHTRAFLRSSCNANSVSRATRPLGGSCRNYDEPWCGLSEIASRAKWRSTRRMWAGWSPGVTPVVCVTARR